jgi:hypothetical protein
LKIRYFFFQIFLLSYLHSADVIGNGVFEQGEIVKFEKCDKYKWCSIENTPFYAKGQFFEPMKNGFYRKRTQKKTFLYVKNSDLLKNNSKKSFLKTPEDRLKKSEIQKIKKNIKYGYTRVSLLDFKKKTQKKVLASSVIKKEKKIVVKKKVIKQETVKKDIVKKEVVKQETVKKDIVKIEVVKQEAVMKGTVMKNIVQKKVAKQEIMMEEIVMEEFMIQEFIMPQLPQKKDLFLYLSLGQSTIDSDFDSSSRNISLDKNGIYIDLGVGYRFRDIIFSTLSYQRATFNEVNIDNLYASLNYQFRKIPLKPYVGVLIGLSRLEWSKYPISGTNVNNNESTTFLEGLQLGFEYSFSDQWSTFGEYQILINKHNTKILDDNLKIAFQNNLNIGVYYKF